MELSEAKEKLTDYKLHGYNKFFIKNNMDRVATKLEIEEMIDTVLKALDNSISKDDIRKKMEEIDKQGDTGCVRQMAYYFDDRTFVDKEGAIKILKQLLGE